MKILMGTGLWLVAAVSSLVAQQESYVWVANGATTNGVTVHTAAGAPVTTLTTGYSFNQPYDIVYVPRYDMIVVSNNVGGSLTVINATTFAFIQSVNLVSASNLRGMSVSGDEEWVFVAGVHAGNETAVFQLRLADLSGSLLGSIPDGSNFAEDCVVINASRVGGSGNAPGKVYYSVPNGDYIGVLQFPSGAATSVSLGVPVITPDIGIPTSLERSPDHSVIYGGCTTVVGTNFNILRIVPGAGAIDTPSQALLFSDSFNKGNEIFDIAFRKDGSGRAYVMARSGAIGNEIHEMNIAGTDLGVAFEAAAGAFGGRIRHDLTPDRLYIGNPGASIYGQSIASTQPVGNPATITSGSSPNAFAFSPRPLPPGISGVCPSGMISAIGTLVEIRGGGFNPACTVDFYDDSGIPFPRVVTFVNSGFLQVNGDGLAPGIFEVRVTNPDLQNFRLVNFFLSIQAPTTTSPFAPVVLPSRFQGYALRAFPQYAMASDLLDAVRLQVGSYNPSTIRIFLQNGSGYVELDKIPANQPCDLAGRPFWVLTRFGGTLALNLPGVGISLSDVGRQEKVQILLPGWNMFTNPTYNVAGGRMALTDIAVFSDGALTVLEGSMDLTAGSAITSFPVEFVNNAYNFLTATDLLSANEGYWIRNNTAGPLFLRFLSSDAVAKSKPTAFKAGVAKALAVPAGDTLPPAPPGSGMDDDGGTSGCGALGLEALLVLGFFRAARRRRRAA